MPLIPFPNVPSVAGVPALAGSPISDVVALLTSDDPGVSGLTADAEWGLFDDSGNAVLTVDAVISVEHVKDYRVSNYPIEQGSFASYNKVEEPFAHRIVVAKAGSQSDRVDFYAQLDAIAKGLDLYTIYTPEAHFHNSNVTGWRIPRSAQRGAQMLLAELTVEQIRPAGSSTFTSTARPSGAAQQSGGTVQTQAPSSAQATAAAGGST